MPGITPAPRQKPAARLLAGARGKPSHRESEQQRAFVKRFRMDPRTKHLPACAIPNAGKRSKVLGGIMKAEGMEAGAPDWVLFCPERLPPALPGGYVAPAHGLALEFKDPEIVNPKPSPDQAIFRDKLAAQRYAYHIVQTQEEAWRVLCDYLGLEADL